MFFTKKRITKRWPHYDLISEIWPELYKDTSLGKVQLDTRTHMCVSEWNYYLSAIAACYNIALQFQYLRESVEYTLFPINARILVAV